MTQDIFELLKQKENENKKEKKFYVYYDPVTGEIIHFRNYIENDILPFIEMSEADIHESIENFIPKNYFVLETSDGLKLIKSEKIINQIDINNIIHQVIKITSENQIESIQPYDLIIEQDNKNKLFKITASPEIKKRIFAQNLLHLVMYIYVTAEDDPNILYQTLEFKMDDLKYESYIINFDDNINEPCNLFLKKYFQTYLHVDIR